MRKTDFPWPHIVGAWLCAGWLLLTMPPVAWPWRVVSFASGLVLYLTIGQALWRKRWDEETKP